jgi:GT2 family glycosyltransferase
LARAIDALDSDAAGARVAALAGAIVPAEPATPVEAYIARRRWIDQEKFLQAGRRYSPPFAATANLAIRRAAFDSLGGFDPELSTAGEDADWCWRAARAGWTLRYAPQAVVIHHHRATLGGLCRQSYHYGIGNAELFAKWRGESGARVWIEPDHYIWSFKGFLRAPFAPLARREPFYDGLANLATALGRARGGLRRGVIVI